MSSSFHNVENGVSRYLGTITLINAASYCIGPAAVVLGIPNPVLWGVLVATLNFIPHIAPLLAWSSSSSSPRLLINHQLRNGVSSAFAVRRLPRATRSLLWSLAGRCSFPARHSLSTFWGWLWGITGGPHGRRSWLLKIICDHRMPFAPWASSSPASLLPTQPERIQRPAPACCLQPLPRDVANVTKLHRSFPGNHATLLSAGRSRLLVAVPLVWRRDHRRDHHFLRRGDVEPRCSR